MLNQVLMSGIMLESVDLCRKNAKTSAYTNNKAFGRILKVDSVGDELV